MNPRHGPRAIVRPPANLTTCGHTDMHTTHSHQYALANVIRIGLPRLGCETRPADTQQQQHHHTQRTIERSSPILARARLVPLERFIDIPKAHSTRHTRHHANTHMTSVCAIQMSPVLACVAYCGHINQQRNQHARVPCTLRQRRVAAARAAESRCEISLRAGAKEACAHLPHQRIVCGYVVFVEMPLANVICLSHTQHVIIITPTPKST
jgi:hypothetical protein